MPPLVLLVLSLAGVSVLIVCLVHLSVRLGNWEADNEKKEDEERQNQREKRAADAGQSAYHAIVARLDTIADQLEAEHKEDRRHDRKRTFLETLGITAAIAAAFFALWLAWTTSEQLYDTRKTNIVQFRGYISAAVAEAPNSFVAPGNYGASAKFINVGATPVRVIAYHLHF